MKNVTAVPSVAMKPDYSLEFAFEFDDGTKEVFSCAPKFVSELLLRVSSFNMGQLPTTETPAKAIGVAYEGGNGRVLIQIPSGDKTLQIAMGHERAAYLGNQLVEAARKSIEPQPKSS